MAQTAVENTPTNKNVVGSITLEDGFTVESNYETPEQLREGLGVEEPPAEPTEPAAAPATEDRPRRNRRSDPRAAVETAIGRQREAERLAATEKERADKLAAEIESLKKVPVVAAAAPAAAPLAGAPAPVAAPQAPVQAQPQMTAADYERYMAMPDAPKETDARFAGENGWKAYQFAVNHFVTQKMLQEHSQRMAAQTAEQQVYSQFSQRLAAAKTRIPDFDQRFNPQTPIDERIFPYIQRLENAPDVMLYLSEHQDIAQRLTTLHPVDQIGQIGEIAGSLKAQSAAASSSASARPATSQAKPPTKRVVGAPPAATDEPPGDDASDAEFDAYWKPRRAAVRQRRHR